MEIRDNLPSIDGQQLWGVLWNHRTKSLMHLLQENEALYKLKIFKGNIIVEQLQLYEKELTTGESDFPVFVLKRIIEKNKFKIIMETSKKIDPVLFGYRHDQPGIVTLKASCRVFIFIHYDIHLIVFDNENDHLPPFVQQNMKIVKEMNEGSFAFVNIVFSLISRKLVVVKAVKLNGDRDNEKSKMIQHELDYLRQFQHPNIVKVLERETNIYDSYFCLEYANRGSCKRYVLNNNISESLSKSFFRQILLAVEYLHNNEILHRAIKPLNILVFQEKGDIKLKLADFASACKTSDENLLLKLQGSIHWLPPEVAKLLLFNLPNVCYNKFTDIWSIGATFFYILTKENPFYRLYSSRKFQNKLLKNEWTQKDCSSVLHFVSKDKEIINFVSSCFKIKESERPSVSKLLQSPVLNQ